MTMASPLSRPRILLAVILLATFFAVDRFLVQARMKAFANAEAALRSTEDRLYRARTESSRAAQIASALGDDGEAAAAGDSPIAIDYLNGLLAKRGLRKVDLGTDVGAESVRGEAIRLTVQGSYERLVLFIRDLESSRVPIVLRDVRIAAVEEGATLEMRVRLEIEGKTS